MLHPFLPSSLISSTITTVILSCPTPLQFYEEFLSSSPTFLLFNFIKNYCCHPLLLYSSLILSTIPAVILY
jgi:hypothetical protein